mmetsp:Transcript_111182/g.321399  ORF Transcript_111182/g.321399 Transcript_111182/m.321399 type:complete len:205 (+) Transcript_111182:163-777(+)
MRYSKSRGNNWYRRGHSRATLVEVLRAAQGDALNENSNAASHADNWKNNRYTQREQEVEGAPPFMGALGRGAASDVIDGEANNSRRQNPWCGADPVHDGRSRRFNIVRRPHLAWCLSQALSDECGASAGDACHEDDRADRQVHHAVKAQLSVRMLLADASASVPRDPAGLARRTSALNRRMAELARAVAVREGLAAPQDRPICF